MQRLTVILSLFLLVGLTGCGKNGNTAAEVKPQAQAGTKIAILTQNGELKLTADQARELDIVMQWMDRDLVKITTQAGFQPVLIKKLQDYRPELGKLLIVTVVRFDAGNRAARAFVGYGAGAASLDLGYRLQDEKGALLSEWRDGVGSSRGGTYCAQTLDRRALDKMSGLLSK